MPIGYLRRNAREVEGLEGLSSHSADDEDYRHNFQADRVCPPSQNMRETKEAATNTGR